MHGAVKLRVLNRLLEQSELKAIQLQAHLLPQLPPEGLIEVFAPFDLAARHAPAATPLVGAHNQHAPAGPHYQGAHGGDRVNHRR